MDTSITIATSIELTCCGQVIYAETFDPAWNIKDGVLTFPGCKCRTCGRSYRGQVTVIEPAAVDTNSGLSTGKAGLIRPELVVHCNDAICLSPLTPEGKRKLERYGTWWFVTGGSKGGTHWLVRSISKQPREESAKKVEVMDLKKQTKQEGDDAFVITRVVPAPEAFDYKRHN